MKRTGQGVADEAARDALALAGDAPAVRELPRDVVLALLEVLQRPWSSLAVVPTAQGPWPLVLGDAMAQLAVAFRLGSIRVVTAVDASVEACEQLRDQIMSLLEAGNRVVIAVDAPHRSAAAVATLAAAEAVLLAVQLGTTPQEALGELVRVIGRDRILGGIVVHPRAARAR